MVRSWIVVACVVVLVVAGVGWGMLHRTVEQIAADNLSNSSFDRQHTSTPWQLGLPWDNVSLAVDGLELAAWWIPSAGGPNGETTVILVHGYSANMGKVLKRWGPNLHEAGFSVMTLDLRNHGASADDGAGVAYGATEQRDVLAAMEYVRQNAPTLGVDADRIVLYGASMGAAAVLAAAATLPPGLQAVIFDSGFASLRFQAHLDGKEQGFPRLLIDMVVDRMEKRAAADPSKAAPERTIRSIDVPLLLAHCSNDTRVDAGSHPRLAALAPAAATWFEPCPVGLSPEHHVDGWMLPEYNRTVVQFLEGSVT